MDTERFGKIRVPDSNVLYFDWTESGGVLTMDIYDGITCGQPNGATLTQQISVSCDGDTLSVDGTTYTRG